MFPSRFKPLVLCFSLHSQNILRRFIVFYDRNKKKTFFLVKIFRFSKINSMPLFRLYVRPDKKRFFKNNIHNRKHLRYYTTVHRCGRLKILVEGENSEGECKRNACLSIFGQVFCYIFGLETSKHEKLTAYLVAVTATMVIKLCSAESLDSTIIF